MSDFPRVSWSEGGSERQARWRSEGEVPPPAQIVIADDTMSAGEAWRLATEGTALLYRGDFNNARQLLQALARRADRKPRSDGREVVLTPTEAFHRHRQTQGQRARALGMLLLPVEPGHIIPLRRAQDVAQACSEAYGPADEPYVVSLRELLGLVGAHEWRKKGVEIPALGARIHPHYGVFSPVRGEYIQLVAQAPMRKGSDRLAFDIGTGTGVLAAVLAKRGVAQVIATDQDPRALACAADNLARLGLAGKVTVQAADLFPDQGAPLIVCNPPWVPATPSSPIERAVYDPESGMLRGFLAGLAEHLTATGEGWLILSDLAEHLGLRTREELLAWIEAGDLRVAGRIDVRPQHPKVFDRSDPLHAARAAEVTSLWRLARR